eukprot:CAMPEP_0204163144 /NCGR_PEP_ID=MMETSP0361-20130328/36138_2 /ASSEMBLY_ACC=CAM_ASM_000343 /TAXON_ID=268821 /ORGANISM="Scrippsiella Hangoei, Strain SHTV-5" /LENGTH=355 /DNA_ID=CAMNT_0051119817 /DNA_START=119 /DNA_END=1187 /DNA_ORIENTATION=-
MPTVSRNMRNGSDGERANISSFHWVATPTRQCCSASWWEAALKWSKNPNTPTLYRNCRQTKLALQHCDSAASQECPLAVHNDAHSPPSLRGLVADDCLPVTPAQPRRPERAQATMRAACNRVLGDADSRPEEARHEVHAAQGSAAEAEQGPQGTAARAEGDDASSIRFGQDAQVRRVQLPKKLGRNLYEDVACLVLAAPHHIVFQDPQAPHDGRPNQGWLPADPTGASAGKFISIMPDSSLLIVRMPLWRVVKLMASVFGQNPASHKACAAANVPCPHKATSTVGVNHRNPQELAEPSKSRQTNAVSDKFISRAIRRMLSSSKPSAMQTAAGLPPKAASANESTVQICVCVGRVT